VQPRIDGKDSATPAIQKAAPGEAEPKPPVVSRSADA
jgi:hypothetical protein